VSKAATAGQEYGLPDSKYKIVRDLEKNFATCVKSLGRQQRDPQTRLFSGPSLYFHVQAMRRRRELGSVGRAINDPRFLEYLYATLAAWGLHRMGSGDRNKTRLREFREFADSLKKCEKQITALEGTNLVDIRTKVEFEKTSNLIWAILKRLRLGMGETRVVSGTKALHHLLPNLVPPVDRAYTIRFCHIQQPSAKRDERVFHGVFRMLWALARECRGRLASRQRCRGLRLPCAMSTSATKLLDDAIIGYVLRGRKKGKRRGQG
jgi:hypothetical protein